MSLAFKILAAPWTYRLWRPYHWQLICRDLFKPAPFPEKDHLQHLRGAVDWLCRAQDCRNGQTDAGGVSAGWSFADGWLPGYPETSGYIIETFFAAASRFNDLNLTARAVRIIDWELSIQNSDGSFPGHFGEVGSRPVIFNTGQIMHGLVEGYLQLQREDCLKAAVRAANWMVERQDEDGCWRRDTHNGIVHTYNTRAAWALLRTALTANDTGLKNAAIKNMDWALTQQTASGWFAQNGFVVGQTPFTHTIAYAIRGLLEGGILLSREAYIHAALRAARGMLAHQLESGYLPGAFGDAWISQGNYCCLTGLAQASVIWSRLARLTDDKNFYEGSRRALLFLKKNHSMNGSMRPDDGGIAGSLPLWGAYSRFEYPNWAVKFFADALMAT